MPRPTAILLIAHGSRHAGANDDTHDIAEKLAQRGPHAIAIAAFLELAEPDIDAGAATCIERGAGRVILLPHFLSAGVHVRRDLCAACERLTERYPGVEFQLAEPIGRHALLLDILLDRANEVKSRSISMPG